MFNFFNKKSFEEEMADLELQLEEAGKLLNSFNHSSLMSIGLSKTNDNVKRGNNLYREVMIKKMKCYKKHNIEPDFITKMYFDNL